MNLQCDFLYSRSAQVIEDLLSATSPTTRVRALRAHCASEALCGEECGANDVLALTLCSLSATAVAATSDAVALIAFAVRELGASPNHIMRFSVTNDTANEENHVVHLTCLQFCALASLDAAFGALLDERADPTARGDSRGRRRAPSATAVAAAAQFCTAPSVATICMHQDASTILQQLLMHRRWSIAAFDWSTMTIPGVRSVTRANDEPPSGLVQLTMSPEFAHRTLAFCAAANSTACLQALLALHTSAEEPFSIEFTCTDLLDALQCAVECRSVASVRMLLRALNVRADARALTVDEIFRALRRGSSAQRQTLPLPHILDDHRAASDNATLTAATHRNSNADDDDDDDDDDNGDACGDARTRAVVRTLRALLRYTQPCTEMNYVQNCTSTNGISRKSHYYPLQLGRLAFKFANYVDMRISLVPVYTLLAEFGADLNITQKGTSLLQKHLLCTTSQSSLLAVEFLLKQRGASVADLQPRRRRERRRGGRGGGTHDEAITSNNSFVGDDGDDGDESSSSSSSLRLLQAMPRGGGYGGGGGDGITFWLSTPEDFAKARRVQPYSTLLTELVFDTHSTSMLRSDAACYHDRLQKMTLLLRHGGEELLRSTALALCNAQLLSQFLVEVARAGAFAALCELYKRDFVAECVANQFYESQLFGEGHIHHLVAHAVAYSIQRCQPRFWQDAFALPSLSATTTSTSSTLSAATSTVTDAVRNEWHDALQAFDAVLARAISHAHIDCHVIQFDCVHSSTIVYFMNFLYAASPVSELLCARVLRALRALPAAASAALLAPARNVARVRYRAMPLFRSPLSAAIQFRHVRTVYALLASTLGDTLSIERALLEVMQAEALDDGAKDRAWRAHLAIADTHVRAQNANDNEHTAHVELVDAWRALKRIRMALYFNAVCARVHCALSARVPHELAVRAIAHTLCQGRSFARLSLNRALPATEATFQYALGERDEQALCAAQSQRRQRSRSECVAIIVPQALRLPL